MLPIITKIEERITLESIWHCCKIRCCISFQELLIRMKPSSTTPEMLFACIWLGIGKAAASATACKLSMTSTPDFQLSLGMAQVAHPCLLPIPISHTTQAINAFAQVSSGATWLQFKQLRLGQLSSAQALLFSIDLEPRCLGQGSPSQAEPPNFYIWS